MAVTKTGFNTWYSSLVDTTFGSEKAAKHYDDLQRRRSLPESEGEKLLNSLTTEQIKSLAMAANVEAENINGRPNWLKVQEEFVAANPEFLPDPRNGAALQAVLIDRGKLTRGGVFVGTMNDLQEAYIDLAEKNALQLREGAPLPQRGDDAEAYALPFEELERRVRGW